MAYIGKARESVIQPTGNYRLIPLTRGKITMVSAHRYAGLSQYRWCVTRNAKSGYYAVRRENGRLVYMNRQILGLAPGDICLGDHINHDTLDNRDENLRIATRAENQRNKTKNSSSLRNGKFKGVYFHKKNNCLRVKIGYRGKSVHVGCFPIGQEEEAARAYDQKARELHGEFAYVNFP